MGNNMSIKQLLCDHIWEDVSIDFIRRDNTYYFMNEENWYSKTQTCVLCNKGRTIEVKSRMEPSVFLKWSFHQ
mgnify:CR=1 FL=1